MKSHCKINPDKININPFAYRHWDNPEYSGTHVSISKDSFLQAVSKYIQENGGFMKCSYEGYAPFCRHVQMPNFINSTLDYVEITPEIEPLIKTGYIARQSFELPVLMRWVNSSDIKDKLIIADFLNLIFYSRSQVLSEIDATNLHQDLEHANNESTDLFTDNWAWSLISIHATSKNGKTVMSPITAMRNALGKQYGGSSFPLDPKAYQESVDFWSKHVSIR